MYNTYEIFPLTFYHISLERILFCNKKETTSLFTQLSRGISIHRVVFQLGTIQILLRGEWNRYLRVRKHECPMTWHGQVAISSNQTSNVVSLVVKRGSPSHFRTVQQWQLPVTSESLIIQPRRIGRLYYQKVVPSTAEYCDNAPTDGKTLVSVGFRIALSCLFSQGTHNLRNKMRTAEGNERRRLFES